MIHFEDLKFVPCLNYDVTRNTRAELSMDNGYLMDIIKKPATRTYKVKTFEINNNKKSYQRGTFPEYGEFPEFAGRERLMVFLNEIVKHNLSDITTDLEEDIKEEEL